MSANVTRGSGGGGASGGGGGSPVPHVSLISMEAADARAVLALDELASAGGFERLFREWERRAPLADAGLRAAWGSCFRMVLHGKCSAVC